MRYIITGGAGFIGSHLVKKLLDLGYHVDIFDNFSTGKRERLDAKLLNSNNFEVYEVDLSKDIYAQIKKSDFKDVEAIFHLAALPRVGRSIDNPIETHEANVTATIRTLDFARKLNIARVIYASSSSVYGIQNDLPVFEGLRENPENPYATQKLIGEEYCKIYNKVYEMQCIMLRFFNVYGPGMATEGAYKLVFANWIEQIKNNKRLSIYGDGKQTRDFTYIDDIVNGLINAMLYNKDFRYLENKPINLCTGIETSVNDLAQMFNWGVEYVENPRGFEEKRKFGSFERARDLLAWEPKTDIERGVNIVKKHYEI